MSKKVGKVGSRIPVKLGIFAVNAEGVLELMPCTGHGCPKGERLCLSSGHIDCSKDGDGTAVPFAQEAFVAIL